jgi:hypothetical protein
MEWTLSFALAFSPTPKQLSGREFSRENASSVVWWVGRDQSKGVNSVGSVMGDEGQIFCMVYGEIPG